MFENLYFFVLLNFRAAGFQNWHLLLQKFRFKFWSFQILSIRYTILIKFLLIKNFLEIFFQKK